MKFCKKCGSMLIPRKKELVCNCGYKEDALESESLILNENIHSKGQKLDVVEKDFETNPKTKITCPKCGNDEAYYWIRQTRGADEAETQFFKCTKCKHQWRAY